MLTDLLNSSPCLDYNFFLLNAYNRVLIKPDFFFSFPRHNQHHADFQNEMIGMISSSEGINVVVVFFLNVSPSRTMSDNKNQLITV